MVVAARREGERILTLDATSVTMLAVGLHNLALLLPEACHLLWNVPFPCDLEDIKEVSMVLVVYHQVFADTLFPLVHLPHFCASVS